MQDLNGRIPEYLRVQRQLHQENVFSRQNIEKNIQREIDASPAVLEKMEECVELLTKWLAHDHAYIRKDGTRNEVKNERLSQMAGTDLAALVNSVCLLVLPISKPELYTSIVGRLAGSLDFSDKADGVKTVAEIVAVMSITGIFSIYREGNGTSMMIRPGFQISQKLQEFIHATKYMPPMICTPKIVRTNHDSPTQSLKGSLIKGKGNHHDYNISLDVINRFNAIELSLDVRLLTLYNELPKKTITDPDRRASFEKMKRDSLKVCADLVANGNRFHLPHGKDKRGRTYADGYHVSTQGSAWKKAVIEFANKELIEGVY